MSDKERLEELINRKPNRWGNLTIYEFERDIKILQEQAERVQELERKIERYREALEFYANEETYETKFATDTDEIFDPFTLIELDEGKKARKALEGEE